MKTQAEWLRAQKLRRLRTEFQKGQKQARAAADADTKIGWRPAAERLIRAAVALGDAERRL